LLIMKRRNSVRMARSAIKSDHSRRSILLKEILNYSKLPVFIKPSKIIF